MHISYSTINADAMTKSHDTKFMVMPKRRADRFKVMLEISRSESSGERACTYPLNGHIFRGKLVTDFERTDSMQTLSLEGALATYTRRGLVRPRLGEGRKLRFGRTGCGGFAG